MARTFGFDVLACPRCGGRLRLIALIEEAAVIERILQHLGVPTKILRRVPGARRRSVWEFPTGPVGMTIPWCSPPVPDWVLSDGPHVRAPEVCPVARRDALPETFRG